MPDERWLRQVNQARTDFVIIEGDLEFFKKRINQRPTAADLRRAAALIAFVPVVLGIVDIEAYWRYFPACSST
jgi:hypothetical protein